MVEVEGERMADMRRAKKFAFDVGWVFTSSIIILLLHFFQKPIMARYLGPDGLGLFSMATMIVGIIEIIAVFGINGALVKFVAEYESKGWRDKVYSLVSSAFITLLIIGIISGVVLFFLSNVFANIFDMPLLSSLLKIYALAFPFSLLHGTIISYFNGLRKMTYYAFIRILLAALSLMFILVFLIIGLGVKGAMLGTVLAIVVTVIIATTIMRKFISFTFSDYRKYTKVLVSFGSRLVGATMINEIYNYVDILMIGYFLTSTDVGYYAVAISLGKFFWLVPRAIARVSYPAMSEYWAKKDIQAMNKLVDRATRYSTCILVFAGMLVIFFAKDIINFLFTSEFLQAILPLIILIIGTVTSGIFGSIGNIFVSIGRANMELMISAINTIGAILLNIALIPTYGIIGAATATTASYMLNVGIRIYFLKEILAIKLDISWYTKMAMLIGLLAVLFYVLAFLNCYLSAMIALLLYTIATMKYFLTKEDRTYFISIAKHTLDVILK